MIARLFVLFAASDHGHFRKDVKEVGRLCQK